MIHCQHNFMWHLSISSKERISIVLLIVIGNFITNLVVSTITELPQLWYKKAHTCTHTHTEEIKTIKRKERNPIN